MTEIVHLPFFLKSIEIIEPCCKNISPVFKDIPGDFLKVILRNLTVVVFQFNSISGDPELCCI